MATQINTNRYNQRIQDGWNDVPDEGDGFGFFKFSRKGVIEYDFMINESGAQMLASPNHPIQTITDIDKFINEHKIKNPIFIFNKVDPKDIVKIDYHVRAKEKLIQKFGKNVQIMEF